MEQTCNVLSVGGVVRIVRMRARSATPPVGETGKSYDRAFFFFRFPLCAPASRSSACLGADEPEGGSPLASKAGSSEGEAVSLPLRLFFFRTRSAPAAGAPFAAAREVGAAAAGGSAALLIELAAALPPLGVVAAAVRT
eukprot:5804709-Prymnesium_polylepis.1